MGAYVNDKDGGKVPAKMGSYGIGISRLVGAIIEASHDSKGIVWPYEVAPFKLALINIKPDSGKIDKFCNNLYEKLDRLYGEVLYDDTSDSVGSKFASNDLIGTPYQLIIGPKNYANNCVEIKYRSSGESELVSIDSLEEKLSKLLN
jgi:prolyl-tRNA synthetase